MTDVEKLAGQYKLPDKIKARLAMNTPPVETGAEFFTIDDYGYLALPWPASSFADQKTDSVTIVRFIIGSKLIVTLHDRPIAALAEFSRIFQPANRRKQPIIGRDSPAGFILGGILNDLYLSLLKEIKAEDQKLKLLHRQPVSARLTHLKKNRQDINSRQKLINVHEPTIRRLIPACLHFFGPREQNGLLIKRRFLALQKALSALKRLSLTLKYQNEIILLITTDRTFRRRQRFFGLGLFILIIMVWLIIFYR